MVRWLAILLLLASCSGCMMMDDLLFGDDVPAGSPPPGTCAVNPRPMPQTVEPGLLNR
jgi:hypothetical protein